MLQVFKNGSLFDGDFFETLYGDLFSAAERSAAVGAIPVDIQEYPDRYELLADIPGVPEESIQIEFKDRILTIETERSREKDDARKQLKTERYSGKFRRSFSIEAGIDSDKISAKSKDGVLTVVLPKVPTALPRKIQIN